MCKQETPLEKLTTKKTCTMVIDAEIYGIIRAELERNGNIIGPYDMQLAAQALRAGYVFVTNNIREFKKIKKLRIENWIW